jgi:transcriptional regulator with XRE-family HTH domain
MTGRPKLERLVADRRRFVLRELGAEIRRLREDAGLTRAALGRAAGVDPAFLGRIEDAEREPSISTTIALSIALGTDLRIRLFPNDGPRLRDRRQSLMIEVLIASLDGRWVAHPEAPVLHPVRGVVDVALHDRDANALVVVEAESGLHRQEQHLRWSAQKAEAVRRDPRWADASPTLSRLLLLRSTSANRALARQVPATLAAAFPGPQVGALESLTGRAAWPGSSLIWVSVETGRARLLAR